jgi:hypothetical protein
MDTLYACCAGLDVHKQTVVATVRRRKDNGKVCEQTRPPDFLLVSAAAEDKSAGTLEPKALQERSIKTMGTSHPGVLMLFPNNQPGAAPELAAKENNHLVLNTKVGISVGGKNVGFMGIGLTMVGHAD